MNAKTESVKHTGSGGIVRVRLATLDGSSVARRAAEILARREYGRRAGVGTFRLDSYAADGSSHTYQAFVGRPAPDGGMNGHNIWIYA